MTQFVVPQIEGDVKTHIKRRAEWHGCGMDEGIRGVLRKAANKEGRAVT